ncbi:Tk-subtilisin [Candidatus Gugararchaeum adminiculabundum]|nr:Tk-subtilisin [Candidatus Gugararchaeum adminiculabundum]
MDSTKLFAVVAVVIVLAGIYFAWQWYVEISGKDNLLVQGKTYFVYFKNMSEEQMKTELKKSGGVLRYTYQNMSFISAKLSEKNIEGLKNNKKVESVEEAVIAKVDFAPSNIVNLGTNNTDEVIPWGIGEIGAQGAWKKSKGSFARIAIIGTGISLGHSELAANTAWAVNVLEKGPALDGQGSGTHAAGIIAADENGIGIIGVAPEAKLYVIKACDDKGECLADALAKAIESARTGPDGKIETKGDNAKIILITASSELTLGKAFEAELGAALDEGMLVVGVRGGEAVGYPAGYPKVYSAIPTGFNFTLPSGSPAEAWSAVGYAPGKEIYSTYVNASFAIASGNLEASAHFTGAAALVIAAKPEMSPLKAGGILVNSSSFINNTNRSMGTDFSIINASAAVDWK